MGNLTETISAVVMATLVAVLFKDNLVNLLVGLSFYFGKDFNEGDNVFIDGCEARIVKIGPRSSVFESIHDGKRTWRYVVNSRLKWTRLERIVCDAASGKGAGDAKRC